MPVATQKPGPGAAIIYDVPDYSRDRVVVLANTTIKPNQPLGKITASGKYVPMAPAAVDGSQTFAGLSIYGVATGSVDGAETAIVRNAKLNKAEIDWGAFTTPQINAAIATALTMGIIIEDAI